MRAQLLYLPFLVSLSAAIQAQENPPEDAAFTIGGCMNQVLPTYSSVNFHLTDPGSGVQVNDSIQLKSPLTSYGFTLGLEAGNADKRLYCTSILGIAVGGASNYQFIEVGTPGVGYDTPLPKISIIDII